MTIARIIDGRNQDIVSCETSATVEEAANLLASRRIGALPVFEGDKIVGIFSERDLLYSLSQLGAGVLSRSVGDVMTKPAITVGPEADVIEALSLMTRRRIRHLPVERGGQVVGFVSIGDLVKYRIDLIEAEAEQMREYIRTA